jgi:tagaturonate reductase
MKQLNNTIYKKVKRPIKILQIGEGNFLRAFIDSFIQTMNQDTDFSSNVCVVQPLANGRVDEIAKQDGLYTLLLEGIQNNKKIRTKEIIEVLDDFIDPYKDYEKFLAYAHSEDLMFIISNTTEAGIALYEDDLDFTNTPISYPGKILALLKERYDFFSKDNTRGLYILPCELIDNNGDKLKEIVLKLATLHNFDQAFINWISNNNYFYNTLVDRIVPGYPKEASKDLEKELGYIDHNLVKGEVFHLWVISGNPKLLEVLPIQDTNLNIIFTKDIKPFKERKVKILNGAHTCMVPVAYLAGLTTVSEVMSTPYLSKWIYDFLTLEVLPTIPMDQKEINLFIDDVLERFKNPFIHHKLLDIALNSMTKYKTRILPTVIDYYNIKEKLPTYALFSFAALCHLYQIQNEHGQPLIKDNQEFLDFWSSIKGSTILDSELIDKVVCLPHWNYDFYKMDGAVEYIQNCYSKIKKNGIHPALLELFGDTYE